MTQMVQQAMTSVAVGGDYYAPTDADYEANCEKAKELLAEAGYPDGEGFPVVEYLYNTSEAHKQLQKLCSLCGKMYLV